MIVFIPLDAVCPINISSVLSTGKPALSIVANCLQKTKISLALTPVPKEKEVFSFFLISFFFLV